MRTKKAAEDNYVLFLITFLIRPFTSQLICLNLNFQILKFQIKLQVPWSRNPSIDLRSCGLAQIGVLTLDGLDPPALLRPLFLRQRPTE